MEAIIAALLNDTIFEPTADPKICDASLAPSDQPRKSPLVKKKRIIT
jgi:hypothetical protein